MQDLKELAALALIGGMVGVMAIVDAISDKLGNRENQNDW